MILIRTHSIDLRISENLLEREQSLSAIVQTMKSVVTISIPAIDCVFCLVFVFLVPISFLRRFVSYDQGGGASSCFPGLRLAAVVLSISSRFSPFLFWFLFLIQTKTARSNTITTVIGDGSSIIIELSTSWAFFYL